MHNKQSFFLKFILMAVPFVIYGCYSIESAERGAPTQEHNASNPILKKLTEFKEKWYKNFNALNEEADRTDENIAKTEKNLDEAIDNLSSYFREAANYLEKYRISKDQVEEDYKKLSIELEFNHKSLELCNSVLKLLYTNLHKTQSQLDELKKHSEELTNTIDQLKTKRENILTSIKDLSEENEKNKQATEQKIDLEYIKASIKNLGYIPEEYLQSLPEDGEGLDHEVAKEIMNHMRTVIHYTKYLYLDDMEAPARILNTDELQRSSYEFDRGYDRKDSEMKAFNEENTRIDSQIDKLNDGAIIGSQYYIKTIEEDILKKEEELYKNSEKLKDKQAEKSIEEKNKLKDEEKITNLNTEITNLEKYGKSIETKLTELQTEKNKTIELLRQKRDLENTKNLTYLDLRKQYTRQAAERYAIYEINISKFRNIRDSGIRGYQSILANIYKFGGENCGAADRLKMLNDMSIAALNCLEEEREQLHTSLGNLTNKYEKTKKTISLVHSIRAFIEEIDSIIRTNESESAIITLGPNKCASNITKCKKFIFELATVIEVIAPGGDSTKERYDEVQIKNYKIESRMINGINTQINIGGERNIDLFENGNLVETIFKTIRDDLPHCAPLSKICK